MSYDLFRYLSIISVDVSVSSDTPATHRILVPIVITSETNRYVGRSGPESRCRCLVFPLHFLDGYPERAASFRRSNSSLMNVEAFR